MTKLLNAHIIFEFKKLIRIPAFWVPAVLFPTMLFSFFGVSAAEDSFRARYVMASFAIYAVVGVVFYQFSASIAQERESAFDRWARTLANAGLPSVVARLATAVFFGSCAVGLVLIAAHLFTLPGTAFGEVARLIGVCILSAIPAALMAVTLGYVASSRAAVALANLIFLPLAYLGGLWIPPMQFPATIETISTYTPTRHMAELAWHAVSGASLPVESLLAIGAYTLLFGATATLAAARDRAKRFG